jgi:hypothetical protein
MSWSKFSLHLEDLDAKYHCAKLVYEGKLYLTTKTLLKNPLITLARSDLIVESEVQNKGIDSDFSRRYTETNKSRRTSEPMEKILSLTNNYDDFCRLLLHLPKF